MDENGTPPEHSTRVRYWNSGPALGAFLALIFAGSFLGLDVWAGVYGLILGGVGLLMAIFGPSVKLPRLWWILGGLYLLFGLGALLPASWFGALPAWREHLAAVGIPTGTQVAVQGKLAGDGWIIFAVILTSGLWLAGHRPSGAQARVLALLFICGVAIYAIVSRLEYKPADPESLFGFFPNRNNTATYLAMGAICGLASTLQALKDKKYFPMVVGILATGICLVAAGLWSISRGGILLLLIGCVLWVPLMGLRQLGRNGIRALGLMVLAAAGLFLTANTKAKQRLSESLAKMAEAIEMISPNSEDGLAPKNARFDEATAKLDFRIPTMLDALGLIRDYKWTGVGAGQFTYIFPQYRVHTSVHNDMENIHPESDWLWMATETGVPSTLALIGLTVLAGVASARSIIGGRDRILRSGCLVAAFLVPIHACFDTPGHRPVITLAAVFLLVLSMRRETAVKVRGMPSAWPLRIAGVAIVGLAAVVCRAQWGEGPQPAVMQAQLALAQAQQLLKQDESQRDAVTKGGGTYNPKPQDDPLEKAIADVDRARLAVPLDRDLPHMASFLALYFDDKQAEVDQYFTVSRELNPTSVKEPFVQGWSWLERDPERARTTWKIALDKARELDRVHPGNRWSEAETLKAIQSLKSGHPGMNQFFPYEEGK